MTVSYAIYEKLRCARNVSDYEVANATGISTPTLSNWKAGRYAPKVDKIKKIADYFGVPIEYFLTEEEK